MSIIFIDIETTGLPKLEKFNKYYHPSLSKYYDSSRMIELGYQVFNEEGNLVLEENDIILNDFDILNSHIHGITKKEIKNKGILLESSLNKLLENVKDCSKIIAHNIKFDYNILLSELYRFKNNSKLINKLESLEKICTMKLGKKILKLKKNPKLVYLYETIFDKKITQTHRALEDTRLCSSCYYHISNL